MFIVKTNNVTLMFQIPPEKHTPPLIVCTVVGGRGGASGVGVGYVSLTAFEKGVPSYVLGDESICSQRH